VYRVILNLVGNALKFTETGEVFIRAFLSESLTEKNIRVGIEVKDTGIGIPDDKQDIIFEKLRRLTPSYEGKIEGSGIGLYIVDQYVKHMNGCITVESAVGKGSTFTVVLPMTIASNLFLSESKKEKVLTSEANISSKVTSTITAPANFGGSYTEEKTLAKDAPLFLLVEDSPIIQMAMRALLNEAGFRVDVASSGEEAVQMFSAGKYSLIYMDIGLPVMNGYETTQAIRAKEKTEHASGLTPIIALTGHGAVDVKTFCGQAGMQSVLSKPLTREQVEMIWRRYGKDESIHVPGLTLIDSPSMNIQIIDLSATITLLGTEKQARDMFALFAKELTEQFLPNIEKLIRQHLHEDLQKQLHAIMGALCYVKAPLLHQAVADLQFAAQNDVHTIETAHQQLQKEAENFIELYQKMKHQGEI
jgi:CheY-like chemotaxis protein